MTRIATIAFAAATLLSTAAPTFAWDSATAPRASEAGTSRIVVVLCERDAMTQAAFRSQYGPHPTFVTVDQVMSARATGERWSAPRCMNAREHGRLTQAMARRSATR